MSAPNQKSVTQQAVNAYKLIKLIKYILSILNVKVLLIIGLIFVFVVMMIGAVLMNTSGGGNGDYSGEISNHNLSETTMQWLSAVTAEAEKQGVVDLVPYIMAIIEVESKGTGTPDIMQSAESAGLGRNGFDNAQDSIAQGIKYLKNAMTLGGAFEEGASKDYLGIIQSYNFGTAYVTYLKNNNLKHSVDVAQTYSRTIVAPSLGNHIGTTYSYVNAVSSSYGQTFLYRNGGNYYYADLVNQFVTVGSGDIPVGDDVFKTIMAEALKYEGDAYVWAGSNPSTGFDCSGLMQYVFAKAGIQLPRTAIEQYGATEPISISEAQPGDLIFFKGTYGAPDHISHVGIYIDGTRMYDANGSGVGYHYWTDSYWQKHFTSIHRIKR